MRVAVIACLIWAASLAAALADGTASPTMLTWSYKCSPGIQCPSTCTSGGKNLFSTSDYLSLTISHMSNHLFWIKVDTGQKPVDYVIEADQLLCTISGATLASVRYQAPGALPPRHQ
jgi:hypothetical protein